MRLFKEWSLLETDKDVADLLWSKYPEKIRHFKEEFAKARMSFELSIKVETFKIVHTLRELNYTTYCSLFADPVFRGRFQNGEAEAMR